jgi:hypothetical protein
VLTEGAHGGLLQVKNASGTPVASVMATSAGGGYWQINDPGGNTAAEAGFDGAVGVVRAGPYFLCAPGARTALVGASPPPDCIKGRLK